MKNDYRNDKQLLEEAYNQVKINEDFGVGAMIGIGAAAVIGGYFGVKALQGAKSLLVKGLGTLAFNAAEKLGDMKAEKLRQLKIKEINVVINKLKNDQEFMQLVNNLNNAPAERALKQQRPELYTKRGEPRSADKQIFADAKRARPKAIKELKNYLDSKLSEEENRLFDEIYKAAAFKSGGIDPDLGPGLEQF